MIDRSVVGGFYRVHTERGRDENLNAPGMHFVPLAFATSCNLPDCRAAAAGQRAEPLLHVRRRRAPGAAGGVDRAREHGVAGARSAVGAGRRRHRRLIVTRWRSSLLFIVDPLAKLKTYKDSTVAMMREAARARPRDLRLHGRRDGVRRRRPRRRCIACAITPAGRPLVRGPRRGGRAAHRVRRGADAQGSAVRHRVPERDAAAVARGGRGRARRQRPAGAARPQREARDHGVPAVHAADAGDPRHRADQGVPPRARRRRRQAARRHGRHRRLPR